MAVRARGRRVRLVVADDIGAAAVLGCGAPLIAVSPRLLDRLDVGEIDRVVIHEWAHVQRRDDLLQLADAAVRVTAGWHPAIYWLLRQLSLEREAACDAVAVDVTGCPRRYAASLAAVASARSKPRRLAIAAGVLSAPPLRVRIMRILSMQQLASAKLSATAVAAGVLVIGVLASEMAARPLIHAPATAIFDVNPLPDARHAEPVASPVDRATTRTPSPRPRVERRAARERVATAAAATLDTSVPVDTPPGSAPSHAELVRDDAGEPVQASASSDPVYETAAGLEPEDSLPLTAPPANDNAPAAAPLVPTAGRAATAPWVLASNAAVAVARGSGKAATATSGVFTRAGRRLASTF
jgi:hypothetical protein